jgi:thiol-disulfide isomerase/thioredoxin
MKVLLPLALLLASCAVGTRDGLATGTAAPSLVAEEWINTEGPIALADLRGAPVLVEFWSKDCSPCRGRIGEMQALQAEHPELRIVTIHMSLESQAPLQDADAVRDFVREWGITYPVGIPQDGSPSDAFAFRYLPHAVLLDAEGAVVWSANPGGGDLTAAVRAHLGG